MAPTTPQHTHTHPYSLPIYLRKAALSVVVSPNVSEEKGATSAFPLKFHWHVIIRIKRNILPVLMGCSLSPHRLLLVIRTTLISVMGSLVLSLHICLSLFTQCPRPGRIPSTGPRCRPRCGSSAPREPLIVSHAP